MPSCHTVAIGRKAGLIREAERFELPLETVQAGRGGGDLPKACGLLEVDPADIALSALKKCEYRDSIILRLFNPTSNHLQGQVTCHFPFRKAWQTNLNEERQSRCETVAETVIFPCGPKKIVTLEIVPELSERRGR